MPTNVALHLGSLTCGAENEHGSEPYIWPLMIADETGIPFIRTPTPEWAAKVLASEMTAGQSILIPTGMDGTLTSAFESPAAGLVVLIVALFEKDSSPRHGSVAVLRHIEDRSLAFVGNHLAECRQSNGDRVDLRNQLASSFDLGGAESDELSLLERATTRLSSGSFDDSVGFAFMTFSGPALVDRSFDFNLNSSSEQWSLSAALQVSRTFVLCRAERDAAAAAQAVVQGLQTRRATLQDQLHHATPQQKPTIVDQITHIAEVELPAAEAALAQAEAALQACLARFETHGTLTPVTPIVMG